MAGASLAPLCSPRQELKRCRTQSGMPPPAASPGIVNRMEMKGNKKQNSLQLLVAPLVISALPGMSMMTLQAASVTGIVPAAERAMIAE